MCVRHNLILQQIVLKKISIQQKHCTAPYTEFSHTLIFFKAFLVENINIYRINISHSTKVVGGNFANIFLMGEFLLYHWHSHFKISTWTSHNSWVCACVCVVEFLRTFSKLWSKVTPVSVLKPSGRIVKRKKKKKKKKEPFPLIKVFLFLQIVRPSLGKNWTCPWDCSPRTWSRAHQSGYGWRGGRLCGFNLAVCIRVYMRRLWGLSVFLSQQVRGDVPRLGLCLLPVTVVLLPIGGFRRAAAPLVLPPEAPQFGAPVFPPLEGQGGAVRHQATLLRAPAPFPLLCTDQEEGPPNVEGWAATAEVTVWDPEGVGAPAHTGSGPRTEDGLDWDGELPPRTWTLHPSHLHLQHWETQRCNINSSCFFFL